jgi:hypothetical protein
MIVSESATVSGFIPLGKHTLSLCAITYDAVFSNGKLGEVETEEGVLVIRRIHVEMRLVAPEEARATVERTHGIYPMRCPLYRTLHKTIQLTSSFELVAP